MSDNICPCPNPPGGSHSCPANHVAVCRVIDGQAHGRCYPITRAFRVRLQMHGISDPEIANWLLATLFPEAHPVEFGTRFELDIPGGRIWDRATNERIQFRLPGRHKGFGGTAPSGADTPPSIPSQGGKARTKQRQLEIYR